MSDAPSLDAAGAQACAPLVIARRHPALEGVSPTPRLAADAPPDWLKAMPSEADAASLGGARLRTLKQCPPLIDAFGAGLLIPLICDLQVTPGRNGPSFEWDWTFPALPEERFARAPISAHAPEQAAGAPLPIKGRFALKFMNLWTFETPPGWSLLFTHPLNREDLPFRTLSGVVDCDRFRDGLVHFPALWTDDGFTGRLPAGTPVAQAIPIPRGLGLRLEAQAADQISATRAIQGRLAEERGVYRKVFRAKRRVS